MSTYLIWGAIWMLTAITIVWIARPACSEETAGDPEWLAQIRKDHPRLFFNAETWPKVRERALNQESEWYDKLKRRVDRCPEEPEVKDWGTEAAATAFVFRMTGEARYLELIKKLLHRSIEHYHARNAEGWAAHWYSTSRVNAWSAYDWIYEDGRVGVSFRFGENETRVLFAAEGRAAGHIRITSAGRTLVDKALTELVQPQIGLSARS